MSGGVSYIANCYGVANNRYMKKIRSEGALKVHHVLGRYGWAMSQYLPTGGFRWITEKDVNKIDLAKNKEDSKRGLILEVDLEYPLELHKLRNDYSLAPEKIKVTKEMLSLYCESIREKFNITIGQVHKLIPTLGSKGKYVLHYRKLQLYLNLGLKVTKVHRVSELISNHGLSNISTSTLRNESTQKIHSKRFLQTN